MSISGDSPTALHLSTAKRPVGARIRLSVISFFLTLACGCSSTAAIADNDDTVIATTARVALLERCREPAARGVGAILVSIGKAIFPKLLNVGVGWAERKLQEKADSYNASATANTAGVFFSALGPAPVTVESRYECLSIAYGPTLSADERVVADLGYPKELGLAVKPNLYLELQIVYQKEGGKLFARLAPLRIEFNAPMSRSGSIKDVVATVTFTYLIASEDDVTNVDAAFILPALTNLRPGLRMRGESLASVSTSWQQLPQPLEAVVSGIDLTQADNYVVPVTVSVAIAETEKGGGQALFVALSGALQESKTELIEIITEGVLSGSD